MSGAIARTAHILIANPSGPLAIHTATPADAPRLAPLLRAFGGPPARTDGLAERIAACAGREVALLAEFEGETVGFAFVEVRPAIGDFEPRAELTDLYVRHEDRRRGIGRALMSAAEAHAQASGADSLFLLTGHTNASAKSFYGSLGYTDYALALHKALPQSSDAGHVRSKLELRAKSSSRRSPLGTWQPRHRPRTDNGDDAAVQVSGGA